MIDKIYLQTLKNDKKKNVLTVTYCEASVKTASDSQLWFIKFDFLVSLYHF